MKELGMILRKEWIHLFRDRISFFLMLAMPIILVLLFGFTISTEIKNAKIAVLDQSKDQESQNLIKKIASSSYFQVVAYPESEAEIDQDFKNKNIKLAIIIPNNFEEILTKEKKAVVQIISDVSDLNIASMLNGYIQAILYDYALEFSQSTVASLPFDLSVRMQYNPEMNSVYMFVPGIITLIMIIMTALMASITLSKEMETGSMNMLLITPVKKIYIVLGKIIPYMLLSLLSTVIILVLSVVVFKIPIKGTLFLLLFVCIVFMFTSAAFGLMISALVKTQLNAMMTTMMGLFLPTVLLSGFLFPLDNMPYFFQILANIFPAKWFIIALKDVMIKGSHVADIWLYLTILTVMAVVLVAISLSRIDQREKR
ncbi:MAG: ABC transporter permease [Bacteroidales bacterium]|jgi:ABC-2 type transport system permease protein|nr:ABC transporter permease [Bacteroidales bacterium]